MVTDQKKLLHDIKKAIDSIDSYIGHPKHFETYDKNPMLQDAVERNLEIIGEAVNALLKLNPDIPIKSARRIVDTRNLIIHSYDSIDNVQIWAILVNHLPELKLQVESLLDK